MNEQMTLEQVRHWHQRQARSCGIHDHLQSEGELHDQMANAIDAHLNAAKGEALEVSPEFTDSARAAIAWILWHHQGASSPIGRPLRFALGMGVHEQLPDWRIREAKQWAAMTKASTADFHTASPEDARRLDWLEQGNTVRAMESGDGEDVYFEAVAYFMSPPFERIIGAGSTPREAIDAAMAAREAATT